MAIINGTYTDTCADDSDTTKPTITNGSLNFTKISADGTINATFNWTDETAGAYGNITWIFGLDFNTTGLIALYNFDNNKTQDYSGRGNDGTLNKNPQFNDSAKIEGGYNFNGTNGQYISTGNFYQWNATKQNISISLWANFKNNPDNKFLFAKQGQGDDVRIRTSGASNAIVFTIDPSDSQFFDISTSTGMDSGIWYNIIATYNENANIGNLYINGVSNGTSSTDFTGSGDNANSIVTIASDQGGNNVFNGTIDEVAIFNRSLSASEITRIYNDGTVLRRITSNYTVSGTSGQFNNKTNIKDYCHNTGCIINVTGYITDS